ncbi:unnamed protein product, partial [Amoebophrya sp. A120]
GPRAINKRSGQRPAWACSRKWLKAEHFPGVAGHDAGGGLLCRSGRAPRRTAVRLAGSCWRPLKAAALFLGAAGLEPNKDCPRFPGTEGVGGSATPREDFMARGPRRPPLNSMSPVAPRRIATTQRVRAHWAAVGPWPCTRRGGLWRGGRKRGRRAVATQLEKHCASYIDRKATGIKNEPSAG